MCNNYKQNDNPLPQLISANRRNAHLRTFIFTFGGRTARRKQENSFFILSIDQSVNADYLQFTRVGFNADKIFFFVSSLVPPSSMNNESQNTSLFLHLIIDRQRWQNCNKTILLDSSACKTNPHPCK